MIRQDERAVTAPLEYVYTFAIAAILVTGLIIGATNAAGDQRRRTVEAQMNVVAEQVAGSLEQADRIVQSTDGTPSTLTLEKELPDELLGGGYFVRITDTASGAKVTVSSSLSEADISTRVQLEATSVPSREQILDGGEMTIRYSGPNLVVSDD